MAQELHFFLSALPDHDVILAGHSSSPGDQINPKMAASVPCTTIIIPTNPKTLNPKMNHKLLSVRIRDLCVSDWLPCVQVPRDGLGFMV